LSAKLLYVLKLVFGVMDVNFWISHRSSPSGLTMAKNLRPPTLKSMTFVFETKGFGAHHRSRISFRVKASHTAY
jgi:hypothetical protein